MIGRQAGSLPAESGKLPDFLMRWRHARMIEHNTPAFWQAFKDECEASMRLVIWTLQAPATERHSRIR